MKSTDLQAVFLDRDGTINRERADYVKTWQEYEWLPGARSALAVLAGLGVPIIIITNQSGIGRGMIKAAALEEIHQRVQAQAADCGGRIDHFLVCPHTPADQCSCRKPQPGLLKQAAIAYGLDLRQCVMVGDSLTDYLAAGAAGCDCVLVRTGRQGNELATLLGEQARAPIVDDLSAAVAMILALHRSTNETSVE